MTIEKRKEIVKVLRRHIKAYQQELTFQLEKEAEEIFDKGYATNAETLNKKKIILTDLVLIKRAVENNRPMAHIYGTYESRCQMYPETAKILKKSGLVKGTDYNYGMGTFCFFND